MGLDSNQPCAKARQGYSLLSHLGSVPTEKCLSWKYGYRSLNRFIVFRFPVVGVEGFEPSIFWFQTRRPLQTGPHPDGTVPRT